MENNTAELWFSWFYKKWEKNAPGNLIEQGLSPSQIAERFVYENNDDFIKLAKKIDQDNYEALREFMKLSERELHILKYFLKLVKMKNL